MTTLRNVIEQLDVLKINAYTHEQKTAWLNELEARVQTEVLKTYPGTTLTQYTWAANQSTTLLIDPVYDNCYLLYLFAMIDFNNREWMTYSNSIIMFNTMFADYSEYVRKNVGAFSADRLTLSRAIRLADSTRANSYNPETKTAWINELEKRMQSEIIRSYPGGPLVQYSYDADKDAELLADPAYEGIYIDYLVYRCDLSDGGPLLDKSRIKFEEAWGNYAEFFRHDVEPVADDELTLGRAIRLADGHRANSHNPETKTAWVNDLERRIQTELLRTYPKENLIDYSYSANVNTVLMADRAHAGIYIDYLVYRIDLADGGALLEQSRLKFEESWNRYAGFFRHDVAADNGEGMTLAWAIRLSDGLRANAHNNEIKTACKALTMIIWTTVFWNGWKASRERL